MDHAKLINHRGHSLANNCAQASESPRPQLLLSQELCDLGPAAVEEVDVVPVDQRCKGPQGVHHGLLVEELVIVQDLVQEGHNLVHLALPDPILDPLTQLELRWGLGTCNLLFYNLFIEDLQGFDNESNVSLLVLYIVGALRECS